MTKDEALKMALEALEVANSCVDGYYIPKGKTHLPEIELAITTIKEALAQPEQPPYHHFVSDRFNIDPQTGNLNIGAVKKQEPVAWRYRMSVEDGYSVWNYATYIERQKDDRCEPLYTTPPERTWVGLTNEEMQSIAFESADALSAVFIAEAKLKEKNVL